jgi:hypothetical protein
MQAYPCKYNDFVDEKGRRNRNLTIRKYKE